MRHLIVLPGNSLKNKAWGELIASHYASQFDSVFMMEYDHWESGEANIDFTREAEKLEVHRTTLKEGVEITLFAKSAGSLLALLVLQQKMFVPIQAVFFGMPLDLAADNIFKESWTAIVELTVPSIAFHNETDPTTSYVFTKSILSEHNPTIELITTHQNDHWYGDVETYDPIIVNFIRRQ